MQRMRKGRALRVIMALSIRIDQFLRQISSLSSVAKPVHSTNGAIATAAGRST